MNERVGFVGVGRMGANMARRLKDAGYAIGAVYDLRSDVAAELARELGTRAAATLAEVTAASDVIVTVVTDDAAMRAIYAPQRRLAVDRRGRARRSSTRRRSRPRCTSRSTRRSDRAGGSVLEACMASSIPQARNGELYLMCAGDEAAFARLLPLLGTALVVAALDRRRRQGGRSESAGQHADEHQHRRAGGSARAR